MPGARIAAFVATELVAASTAVAVQSQRDASVGEIVGTVATILTVVGVLFGWYVRVNEPFRERRERRVWKTLEDDAEKFDKLWFKAIERNPERHAQVIFAAIERNPEKFGRLVFRTVDRDDDARAVMRRLIDRLYVEELRVIAQAEQQIDANKDAIRFLEESNERQGAALTKELASAIAMMSNSTRSQTEAFRDFTTEQKRANETFATELKLLRENYIHIKATMDAWDGHERRNPR